MPTFGTANNPAHMVEIGQDPDSADRGGGPRRPPVGYRIPVRNHDTGEVLPQPITVGPGGTWSYSTADALLLDYSLDGGRTWNGPLESDEYRQALDEAARGAQQSAAAAEKIVRDLNDRVPNLGGKAGWEVVPPGVPCVVREGSPNHYATPNTDRPDCPRIYFGAVPPMAADGTQDGDVWFRTVSPWGISLRTAGNWVLVATLAGT